MATQLSSGIYHLDVHDVDFEAAHLYEHLLIASFREHVYTHGLSRYLYGWVEGETFRRVMYITYDFYHPDAEPLFHAFMTNPGRIDYSLLDRELARLQAESRAIVSVFDRRELVAQLAHIDQQVFVDHRQAFAAARYECSKYDEDISSRVIPMKRSSAAFRRITVLFGLENLSLDELVASQRIAPILYEAFDDEMFRMGAYKNDASYLVKEAGTPFYVGGSFYTIRRGQYTTAQMTAALTASLEKIAADVGAHPEQLDHYTAAFVGSALWSDAPRRYYNHSGVITSNRAVAQALSVERLLALLPRVNIRVMSTNDAHLKLLR
ncbi:hypothetical protein CR983_02630 [Candidatus Saccharibacteria bacterium]|nr:MAG: hypothetical protein CR983_02630 [Candidatus Saccharibacteria bacterium]